VRSAFSSGDRDGDLDLCIVSGVGLGADLGLVLHVEAHDATVVDLDVRMRGHALQHGYCLLLLRAADHETSSGTSIVLAIIHNIDG
jgi:hypothetical protein